jgi:hypothetical protein
MEGSSLEGQNCQNNEFVAPDAEEKIRIFINSPHP